MAKSIVNQRYIYKNNSSRFKDADWDLNLDIETARKNKEIVSINDSIALRIIRKITGKEVSEDEINDLKVKIKKLKRKNRTEANIKKIKELQEELDDKTLLKELNSIVFDSVSDWNYANSRKNDIKLNGSKRVRTIGTSGGVKKNTVLFSDEYIHKELNKRLNNGRDENIKYVPAKFEAYKALAFSGSTPVTQPKGVLVIKDAEVDIVSDVLLLSDNGKGEFNLTEEIDYKINKQFTDGCSMVSPELAEQWTIDMGYYTEDEHGNKVADYISSGFNIRNAFLKGMVYTFPFVQFAEEVAIPQGKSYFVKDVWGNDIDIRKVQLIVTTNMLKLWDSYTSIEHYLECCEENGFEFCVAKILPEKLENVRNMNYQFLESYEDLSDEEINDLIKPTANSVKGVLSEDYLKMILFLKGLNLEEKDFRNEELDYIKALMVDERMKDDPFIKQKIHRMLTKKINDAKKGVIEVQGSYEVVSGDIFGQCQYMFGLEVTGLLKANEFYSRTWIDRGVDKIVAYRAPMTVHNNIKAMPLANNGQANKWFRYMKTCLVINAWDTTMEAMNGEDFDADANITTNNPILLNNTRNELPIICEQKGVSKKKITESLLRKANKNGFGNNVGGVTNRCTSMYDVLSKFNKSSNEYKEMMYRIICMQGYQQEIIDSIKGIIPKEVPKHWYDYKSVKINEQKDSDEIKEWKIHNQKLLANKHPYFFIYNYPKLMKKYKKYIKDSDTNCLIRFGLTVEELENKENKTDEEMKFLKYYHLRMPVSNEKSLMNRLCWVVEDEFKDINLQINQPEFDYSFMKSGVKYLKKDKESIQNLYNQYKKEAKAYSINNKTNKVDEVIDRSILINKYRKEIFNVCNNEDMVCDILLDLCYNSNGSKQFVWDVCGDVIVKNLLELNNYTINIPTETNKKTNTYWQGKYYELTSTKISEGEFAIC